MKEMIIVPIEDYEVPTTRTVRGIKVNGVVWEQENEHVFRYKNMTLFWNRGDDWQLSVTVDEGGPCENLLRVNAPSPEGCLGRAQEFARRCDSQLDSVC